MRFPVFHVSELDSTNSEAARRAGEGEGGPLWITTDRQTVGRGRLGRVWQGGDGNLAATLLLSTNKPPRHSGADSLCRRSGRNSNDTGLRSARKGHTEVAQ